MYVGYNLLMDKIVSQTPPSNLSNQITPNVVEKPIANQDLVIENSKSNLSPFSTFTIYKILIGVFIISILMAAASLIGLKFKRGQPKEAQLKFEVPPLPSPTPTPTLPLHLLQQ